MLFATHGLIVSDNAPAFTSEEFKRFVQMNGITSAPYHPATNGLAEEWFILEARFGGGSD